MGWFPQKCLAMAKDILLATVWKGAAAWRYYQKLGDASNILHCTAQPVPQHKDLSTNVTNAEVQKLFYTCEETISCTGKMQV
jgi:hypothetical protein